MHQLNRIVGLLLLFFGTITCHSQTTEKAIDETGIASYYNNRYQGKPTASGELYDKNKFTAAHPSIAFGTKIKVVLLSNTKDTVEVVINDRRSKRRGRILDLSYAAAQKIGLVRAGVGKVHIFTD